jgi:hypothetical protein
LATAQLNELLPLCEGKPHPLKDKEVHIHKQVWRRAIALSRFLLESPADRLYAGPSLFRKIKKLRFRWKSGGLSLGCLSILFAPLPTSTVGFDEFERFDSLSCLYLEIWVPIWFQPNLQRSVF